MDVRVFPGMRKAKKFKQSQLRNPMANQKKDFVLNFPLMTTTDSQNFKEIQDIDVHHVVTLEVDFPSTN